MKTFTTLLFLFLFLAPTAKAAPPPEPPQSIVCRGLSGVGFSYAWGGECWCGTGCDPDLGSCEPGVCTINDGGTGCPDCTHSGEYGADCSGFVSKAWQVPDPYSVSACGVARYTAASFTADHEYWNVVPMDSLQPADAVASDSHVILVIDYEDPYGEHEVIEAKGCSYGIVRNSRTFSSVYSGARRINLTTCECEEGEVDSEACGDCGTRSRACVGCLWAPWSACDGPDPTTDTACTPDGTGTGQCATGKRLCVGGWITCQGATPTADVCDGVDNDCDGTVDNGSATTLGEGYPCDSSCGTGESRCIDGALVCVTPEGETCDATPMGTTSPGGCGCSTHAPASLPAGLFLLALIALTIRRQHH